MVVIPLEKYEKLKQLGLGESSATEIKDSVMNDRGGESKPVASLNNERVSGGESKPLVSLNNEEVMKTVPDETIPEDNLLRKEDIVQYLPKTYQHRCRLILFHMKNNDMGWDSLGRLTLKGECILNTHVVDLIRDVIANYKRVHISQCSNHFGKLLIGTHCPKSILSKSFAENGSFDSA